MYLHQQDCTFALLGDCCSSHPSPPRDCFQRLAAAERAGRSSLCSARGSCGRCRPLCVATHYVIGTAVLKTPHASKNMSMFYCLDKQMQPFGVWKMAGSARTRPCVLASSPEQLGPHKLSPEQGLIVICACMYTVNVFE